MNLLVLQDAGAKTTLGHRGFSFYLGTLKRIRAILAVHKVRTHTKPAFLCTAVREWSASRSDLDLDVILRVARACVRVNWMIGVFLTAPSSGIAIKNMETGSPSLFLHFH